MSTLYFVRNGDVEDTFDLAALLVDDHHESVQKATGGLLRRRGSRMSGGSVPSWTNTPIAWHGSP